MVVAGLLFLAFVWIACVMMPRKTAWGAGGPADIEPWTAPPHWEPAAKPIPVYVMLCISTEGNLRAVIQSTKALLAEMPVSEFQFDGRREVFAVTIAEGLRNLYSVDVNPIFYTTPLAHNVLPRNIMDYPALDMHIRTTKRLVDCKVFD